MNLGLGLAVGFVMLFAAAFYLMILVGVVHGLVPAVPTISYGSSVLISILYAGFHNGATWPGAGHRIEDV